MFVLLMEPYAMIRLSILLQPHRTVVANFVPGNFGLLLRNSGSHSRNTEVPVRKTLQRANHNSKDNLKGIVNHSMLRQDSEV